MGGAVVALGNFLYCILALVVWRRGKCGIIIII